jgi:hypothetical protein
MANWYVLKTSRSALFVFSLSSSQLKVNLMPVWKPAVAAVAGIAQRAGGGEEVWPVIFSELAPVSEESAAAVRLLFHRGRTRYKRVMSMMKNGRRRKRPGAILDTESPIFRYKWGVCLQG